MVWCMRRAEVVVVGGESNEWWCVRIAAADRRCGCTAARLGEQAGEVVNGALGERSSGYKQRGMDGGAN
jgi:hypothetical protein